MRKDFDKLPKELQENGFDFHWDNEKVWLLDIPVEEIHIQELDYLFDMPFWQDEGKTPRQIIIELDKYPNKKERILNADVKYPIDIMQNNKGKYLTLDGLHRLAKLSLEGKEKIKVRKIPRNMISLIEK
jgi:hypothetical protein